MVEWIGNMNSLEFMLLVLGANMLLFAVCISPFIRYGLLWAKIKTGVTSTCNGYIENVAPQNYELYAKLRHDLVFPFYLG